MTRASRQNLPKVLEKIEQHKAKKGIPSAPQKFGGNRPLSEIKAKVKENGGTWDQSRFDKGSDYVTFTMKKNQPEIIYNTFNGRFITRDDDGNMVTEESKYDGVPWYDQILNFIYTPL